MDGVMQRCVGGRLEVEVDLALVHWVRYSLGWFLQPSRPPLLLLIRSFGIIRAHLEEDAGKIVYAGADRLSGADYSLVDYNRAGEGGRGWGGVGRG